MEKAQPQKVKRLVCPRCGELQVKVYPWSAIQPQEGVALPVCMKCQSELKRKQSSLKS